AVGDQTMGPWVHRTEVERGIFVAGEDHDARREMCASCPLPAVNASMVWRRPVLSLARLERLNCAKSACADNGSLPEEIISTGVSAHRGFFFLAPITAGRSAGGSAAPLRMGANFPPPSRNASPSPALKPAVTRQLAPARIGSSM